MTNIKKFEKFLVTIKVLYVMGKDKVKFTENELDYLWTHDKNPSLEHLTPEQINILKSHNMIAVA